MCWGSNAARRAGDTLGYSSTPLDMALTGVASITLGESHICTRELDGDVACWGDNSFGQLGDLTATSRWLLPASVVATTRDIVSLIAGPMQTCAVLLPVVGETVPPIVCWGRGEEGQLGVGNDLDRVRYSSTVDFGLRQVGRAGDVTFDPNAGRGQAHSAATW